MYGEDVPYTRKTETASKARRRQLWSAAVGLQQVDGLTPSPYMTGLIERNISGELGFDELFSDIQNYYNSKAAFTAADEDEYEADIVSAHIKELLDVGTFTLSPAMLRSIHGTLFAGVLSEPGQYRPYNVEKSEPVLGGRSVQYGNATSIEYLLDQYIVDEKSKALPKAIDAQLVQRMVTFTTDIWLLHPFPEGNTRTVAVFIQLYLASLGCQVQNEVFAKSSLYYRNALVRNCFRDIRHGVDNEPVFLTRFYQNLILGTDHELKNRYMMVPQYFPEHQEQLELAIALLKSETAQRA